MAGNKLSSLKWKAVVNDNNSSSSSSNDNDDDDNGETGVHLGLSLEKLSLGSRKKKLIVLDDGLLVHRLFCYDPKINVQNYGRPDAIAGSHLLFRRPFCSEFLEFCFERFELGLWSTASKKNIDGALTTIMGELKQKLLFVWDQEKCTDSGFKSLEKKDKPIFLKELRKLWENPTLPWRHGDYSSSNTLLIDDKPYKALLNPPNTAIFPDPYKVDNNDNDTVLGPKGELRLFLDGLVDAEDVPSYVKEHPIGQPAVTESHPDWNYYSKVIRPVS